MNNLNEISEFLAEHSEIRELCNNDFTVRAWFSMAQGGNIDLETTLLGIILGLAKEKKNYFDELVKAKQREMPRNAII